MTKLVICEKNDAAERTSKILSGGKVERGAHRSHYYYMFKRGGEDWVAVGLRGHIISLDYPAQYNSWYRIDPKQLVDIEPIKKVEEKNIVEILKKYGKDSDEVIIATDYDREGELIGVEGLEFVVSVNKKIKIKRAKFSSFTKEEINKAFENLSEVDYNLSKSAECRQVIDLVWGAALTRFLSMASGRVGKDFLSVGRVQTPTLALLVDKEKRILKFKSEPFWEITASLGADVKFEAKHSKDRFTKKEEASSSYEKVKGAKNAEVAEIERKEKNEKPPSPFNTTLFLQAANKLGLSASNAMRIAESLYMSGYTSYPRTDNTVYPPTLNLREILEKFAASSPAFKELAKELLAKKELKPTSGKKSATDHPPIYPSEAVDRSALSGDQWKVYELIVRRFFATLSDDAVGETTRVALNINGEPFVAHGYRVKDAGWRRHYPYNAIKEAEVPALSKGQNVNVNGTELHEKTTQPPNRYSQGGLIQEMERLNLGTKSTRHEIIQKLYDRSYVTDTSIKPTLVGIAVTDALEKYADIITRPEMTGTLESDMDHIAEGNKEMADVVKESQEMLHKAMEILGKNRSEIGSTIKDALRRENMIGICPRCGGELLSRYSRAGKRFVGCSGYPACTNTYSLPQRGRVAGLNKSCENCGAPMIALFAPKRRPIDLCINLGCPVHKLGSAPKEEAGAADAKDEKGTADVKDEKGTAGAKDEKGTAAGAETKPKPKKEAGKARKRKAAPENAASGADVDGSGDTGE